MKGFVKFFLSGLILCMFFLPAAADVHWRGGSALPDLTAGVTGSLLAPHVYAASAPVNDPANAAPPPPAGSNIPPAPPNIAPPPPGPPGPESAVSPPLPGGEAKCREWKMVERRVEDRWDSYGKKQQVPVEKWDWVDVPCNRPATASAPPPSMPPPSGPPADANVPPPAGPPGVNVPPPPPYEFSAPPSVAVIPGTYAYVVPGVDIVFYHGFWYRPYAGRWFWASSYNGPWVFLPPPRVPRVLLGLPPGFYHVPHGYPIIPYAQFHSNWGRWERERYWQGHREWHEGWRHR